jgi:hypothetical protein
MLLLSVLSPITELFPNLYGSWWYPTNNNIDLYHELTLVRSSLVIVVWIPILLRLYILNKEYTILIGTTISVAFLTKLVDYNNTISEKLYILTFLIISKLLYKYVGSIILVYVSFIFVGAKLISDNRNVNLKNDVKGRYIFSLGFLGFLYSLSKI